MQAQPFKGKFLVAASTLKLNDLEHMMLLAKDTQHTFEKISTRIQAADATQADLAMFMLAMDHFRGIVQKTNELLPFGLQNLVRQSTIYHKLQAVEQEFDKLRNQPNQSE